VEWFDLAVVVQEKTRAALISVISNTALTLGKVIIGLVSGSVSILSEGIHSGLDLLAAVIALFAVRASGKPADEQHAYGHGKIENISGTVEALLIFFAAVWIIIEAVHKLMNGVVALENLGWGIVIMAVSAIVNLFVSSYLMRVAKKTNSVALEADALHLRTDIYTSLGVLIGLLLVRFTGWAILDPIIAILVALLIIKAAFDLTKEAFMPLVDVRLDESEYREILKVLEHYSGDFVEFHKLRTRRSGSERHIDLHLVVPKFQSLLEVHELCNRIEKDIKEQLPGTYILIHAEPCSEGEVPCPTCVEKNPTCIECSDKDFKEKESCGVEPTGSV
jgi:cation diffusion facilitator family transporter